MFTTPAIHGDPIFVADRNGANPRRIAIDQTGVHQHYPVWSLDGKWIYFVKGVQATYAVGSVESCG